MWLWCLVGVRLGGERRHGGSRVFGFEIKGDNTPSGTFHAWDGLPGERPHGISLFGDVKDIEIADCYIHHTRGDAIYKNSWAAFTVAGGYWIHHNWLSMTGRQGIANGVGRPTAINDFGWKIEWNRFWDIGLYPIDAEDSRTQANLLSGVYIDFNDFRRWNWQSYTPAFNNRCYAISFGYKLGPEGDRHVLGSISDVYIRRNTFGDSEGCMGFGGDYIPSDPNGATINMRLGSQNISTPKTGVFILDNVWKVRNDQALPGSKYAFVWDCKGLTVQGNVFQGSIVLSKNRNSGVIVTSPNP